MPITNDERLSMHEIQFTNIYYNQYQDKIKHLINLYKPRRSTIQHFNLVIDEFSMIILI